MKIRKFVGLPLAAFLAVGIGMLVAPPAPAHEADVGQVAISEVQKDLGVGFNPATIGMEGLAQQLKIADVAAFTLKEAAVTTTISASPMAIAANQSKTTTVAIAAIGVKAIPVAHAQIAKTSAAEQEVDIAQKAGGDASALKIV